MAQQTNQNALSGKVFSFAAKRHNLLVIRVLLANPHGLGFNAIQKACTPAAKVTPRILSTRLKELEKLKLVSKGLAFGPPPKIEYRVQSNAEGLKKIIEELEGWGRENLD